MVRAKTVKYLCPCCGNEYPEGSYYKSASSLVKTSNRMIVCKSCYLDIFSEFLERFKEEKIALFCLCRLLDIYFNNSLFDSALQQARNQDSNVAQIYMQKCNSLRQYSNLTFLDSEQKDLDSKPNKKKNKLEIEFTGDDQRNRDDVLRLLGYDPFEAENPEDRKHLYNVLIDYLDESTLEDSFKLPACIEIVKTFNQIDKINRAITLMTTDITALSTNVGGIKSLMEAKDKMLRAILAVAKDNGISVNHNNTKSKGAGTLSGIIKQLQEKGIIEAEINLFDIETASGIRQVADISNESIMKQLQFDENDYTDMISQQREMIQKLDSKTINLEEENRLLKLELLKYKQNGDDNE